VRARLWVFAVSEHVFDGELLARDGWRGQFGERVACEGGVYSSCAVEGSFEGEDDDHAGDALLDPAEATALPGPELRADEPDYWNPGTPEVLGEPEVHVGKVNQDGDVRPPAMDAADEFAVLRVDEGGMAQNLGDAHVGDVPGANDLALPLQGHLRAAQAGKRRRRKALAKCRNQVRAIDVSRGFTGGDKDERIGVGGDALSLSSLLLTG
jgi:hypothetical protein